MATIIINVQKLKKETFLYFMASIASTTKILVFYECFILIVYNITNFILKFTI